MHHNLLLDTFFFHALVQHQIVQCLSEAKQVTVLGHSILLLHR